MRRILLPLCLLFCNHALAVTYLVGDTEHDGCDFSNIQDAIDAAAANGFYGNTIVVTNSGTYSNQSLHIGDTTLIIEGGFDSCVYRKPAAQADIGGNLTDPVIRIAPAGSAVQSVSLYNLHVHDGGVSGIFGSTGGGIYLTGNARLYTFDTLIDGNFASSGGGIYVDSIGGAPYLLLGRGTRISDNVATYYGGGVDVTAGRMDIVADQVSIDHNHADDAGGGIAVLGAQVSIGNPWNETSHDASGASVNDNVAGALGGGIFVFGGSARLTANELIVDGNSAALGGGGIAVSGSAQVAMQRDYDGAPLQCPNWRECSRISNNSVGGGGSGTVGGAIALYSHAQADVAQTIVRGNVSEDGSVASVNGATLRLEGVLAEKNRTFSTATHFSSTVRTQFTAADGTATLRVAYSTFGGNTTKATSGDDAPSVDIVAQQNSQLAIYSTAFYDGPSAVTTYSGYTDDCVVQTPGATGAYGTHTRLLVTGAPGFNDAITGDYRLRTESTLNDYCDASIFAPTHRDLILQPRCHDDPRRPDTYGTCDVGAYESDHIFGGRMQ